MSAALHPSTPHEHLDLCSQCEHCDEQLLTCRTSCAHGFLLGQRFVLMRSNPPRAPRQKRGARSSHRWLRACVPFTSAEPCRGAHESRPENGCGKGRYGRVMAGWMIFKQARCGWMIFKPVVLLLFPNNSIICDTPAWCSRTALGHWASQAVRRHELDANKKSSSQRSGMD